MEGGFFKSNLETKLNAYKTESTDKLSKLNEAVAELKSQCKSKYDDTAGAKEADKTKWEEFWKFCSIFGTVTENLTYSKYRIYR